MANKVSDNIRKLRQKKGMSQDRLSKEADLALNTIVKIETGENPNPTVETLEKIAKALGIPNLGAERDVAGLVSQGKSYLLSFLVKGVADNQKISIKFLPSNLNFPEVNISKEWQLINLGPIYFDKIPDPAEKIEITSGSTFWLDYIQLRDTGSLYLIRNSWITPSTCNDENDNPVMVGCAEYRDRENRAHYLKSFSQLCAEEAIGCEALINTQNSSLPFEERFNNDKAPSTDDVIVPADQTEYLIYDKNFSCQATDKGCQKFGSPALLMVSQPLMMMFFSKMTLIFIKPDQFFVERHKWIVKNLLWLAVAALISKILAKNNVNGKKKQLKETLVGSNKKQNSPATPIILKMVFMTSNFIKKMAIRATLAYVQKKKLVANHLLIL